MKPAVLVTPTEAADRPGRQAVSELRWQLRPQLRPQPETRGDVEVRLDSRKSAILRALVEQYVTAAQPVGSHSIAIDPDVAVSSATVRNELAQLEDLGLVEQPHTSAGRVPTQLGYRCFVDQLAAAGRLSASQRQAVSFFFASPHDSLAGLLEETSHLLAQLSDHAGVVVCPKPDVATVRSLHLTPIADDIVVAVAVCSDGAVEREAVRLTEPIDAAHVGAAEDLAASGIVHAPPGAPRRVASSGRPAVDAVAQQVHAAFARHTAGSDEPCFVGGTSRIAAEQDDFSEGEVAELLDLLEQPAVVAQELRDHPVEDVTVRIGSENDLFELRDCAVVLAPYSAGESVLGSLGVLGPTRMDYGRAMGVVTHVSDQLGRTLATYRTTPR